VLSARGVEIGITTVRQSTILAHAAHCLIAVACAHPRTVRTERLGSVPVVVRLPIFATMATL